MAIRPDDSFPTDDFRKHNASNPAMSNPVTSLERPNKAKPTARPGLCKIDHFWNIVLHDLGQRFPMPHHCLGERLDIVTIFLRSMEKSPADAQAVLVKMIEAVRGCDCLPLRSPCLIRYRTSSQTAGLVS